MALGLWLALLALLAKVESPALKVYCENGEYPYSGQCCKKCPAGTHVEEHCNFPHTLGTCKRCTEGEDYTGHENSLEQCLICSECKSGFRMVRPCTVKSNTECQCNHGYYCPPGCEECVKCKQKCPEGQMTVHHCNATTDMKCGSLPTESMNPALSWYWFFIIFAPVGLFLLGIFLWKKRRCASKKDEEKEGCLITASIEIQNSSTSEICLSRNGLSENAELLDSTNTESTSQNVPSAPPLQLPDESAVRSVQPDVRKSNKPYRVVVKKSSSEKLQELYFESRNTVPPVYWKTLMRKSGLSDNDIEKIIRDNSYHTDEQYYQMLKTLQDRFGIGDALCKFLDGLWHTKLNHIYENLVNELISNDIITVETED